MGNGVSIRSAGTLGTTHVVINGEAIPPERLHSLRLFKEVAIDQVGVEMTYVRERTGPDDTGPTLMRFSGMNPEDVLDFLLEHEEPSTASRDGVSVPMTTLTRVKATLQHLAYSVDGVTVFPGCETVIEILPAGWLPTIKKYFKAEEI
jgi:hypothetical protein